MEERCDEFNMIHVRSVGVFRCPRVFGWGIPMPACVRLGCVDVDVRSVGTFASARVGRTERLHALFLARCPSTAGTGPAKRVVLG